MRRSCVAMNGVPIMVFMPTIARFVMPCTNGRAMMMAMDGVKYIVTPVKVPAWLCATFCALFVVFISATYICMLACFKRFIMPKPFPRSLFVVCVLVVILLGTLI